MIAILMIISASIAISAIFGRKIYESLPPALFITTLTVYVLALFLPLNAAVYITLVLILICAAWSIYICVRRDFPVRGLPRPKSKRRLVPYIVPAVICIIFCVLLGNRRVFYYDDLSYWALYTKNIFAIDRLPHLFENCSVDYKDYTPIIQILQYIALFGRRSFSEPALFRTNVCLIYILLLPMLSIFGNDSAGRFERAAAVVLYAIFPHILTAQFYYRLGVDLLLALTFGYVLYYSYLFNGYGPALSGNNESEDAIIYTGRDEVFRIGCIVTGLAFLVLIKSSGIVLGILAIVMFAVKEAVAGKYSDDGKKIRITGMKTMLLLLFAVGPYLSWQLFLHYSWNNGYLSNRVKDGITGRALSFPPYTGEVIRNYVNHFFTYPLTRNNIGATAFLLAIFIIAVYIVTFSLKNQGVHTRVYTALLVCSLAGLAVFCAAHISMYLFVFDEWEAHGLLEYDRYITQYLGGILYVFACILINPDRTGKAGTNTAGKIVTAVSVVIFMALLPYNDMKQYLVPQNYEAMFANEYATMSQNAADEWRLSGITEMNLAHDGTARLTVVGNAWDETMQFVEYEAVPQPIDRILNVPAVEKGKLSGFIYEYMESYMYIAIGAEDAYEGEWQETAEVTADNNPLREGVLYRVDRINGDKTLTPVH